PTLLLSRPTFLSPRLRLLPPPLPRSFSFSFHCSRAPRDLHSFPTRRSSDLSLLHDSPNVKIFEAKCQQSPSTSLSVRVYSKKERDRKSTRLNSSHVSISYAVFCLKKKIKNI